jgi:3'(2'), 5'-bisphosphate nucleotidase
MTQEEARNRPLSLELVQEVVTLARDAGARILEIYETDFSVRKKADRSPLTAADLAAHTVIDAGLAMITPDLPILSEESAEADYAVRSQWRRYWLIDPLDGTREFVKRNGEFTVNIALIDGHEPVLGVVHVPVSGVSYYAVRGLGAFKQEPGQIPVSIQVRAHPEGRLIVTGSRSHGTDTTRKFIANLGDVEVIGIGSALKSCLVAEGRADLYPRFGPTSEWDTAAAQCIVEEAGGRVTDVHLNPLRYNTKRSLLNPHFFVFGDTSRDWRQYLPSD